MVKKGYKQTEVGVIPEKWKDKKLGDVGKVCMCKRIFANQTSNTGEVPFFKIGTFGKEADAYISKGLYEDYKQRFSYPQKGDVLISAAGTLGRTIVFEGKDAYFQDSNIVWLDTDKELLCNEYLYHYYKVIKWGASEGSTIARLYNGIICNTHIALPDVEEQKQIATVLSELDELMSLTEKQIAKKKAIKQGAMQELLAGKRRLPGFAGEWKICRLDEIADFPTATISTDQFDNRFYVGTDNMIAYKGDVKYNELPLIYPKVRQYQTEDIILSNIRPYLQKIWYATRNGGCSNDVLVIRKKDGHAVEPKFLYYQLSRDGFYDEIMANAFTLSGDTAILTVRKESSPKQRESFVNEWYRNLLKQEVAKYLPKWEKTTGLYCSSWQSKYMTTKWGTCNPTSKKIWLNLQLAKKPIECLEYVILHELAHLKVHNHGPEFTAILDQYMPYWREHKRRLNDSPLDYLPSQLE